MGACDFYSVSPGKSAQDAFNAAVKRAQYDHGHGGYSGTIAEKGGDGFVMIKPEPGEAPQQCAQRLINDDDPRVSDKWGPAGCIDLGEGKFLFFGWASS
jgi:hypothetical protein